MTMPAQRLIALHDGTWNEPHNRTNVYRLTRSVRDQDERGVPQKFFYANGVGTCSIDRCRDGVSAGQQGGADRGEAAPSSRPPTLPRTGMQLPG